MRHAVILAQGMSESMRGVSQSDLTPPRSFAKFERIR
jgi:hypothetical protein